MIKKRYLAIPVIAIVLHLFLSNILYFSVEKLFLNVFHITENQFMKYSYLGEILIYIVIIIIFFAFYKFLWRKEESESRTEINSKDVAFSLIAGLGVSGISFVWIMMAEQIPALQKVSKL